MRILHTSDWHVGKTIRSRSRMDEFAAVLDEVVRIAMDREVDLVLVAGDVFDSKAPPPEAEKLVYETLLRLHFAGIRVVVTAGNHDHERRLEAVTGVFDALDVSVVGVLQRPDFAHFVEVPSRDGLELASVAALPFVPERALLASEDLMDEAGARYSRYSDGMRAVFERVASGYRSDAVNILCGHFMVSGARVGGGEQELTVGITYAVETQALPSSGFQYIALGHVHRPQDIPGCLVPGRYSGSLLQLDFGEVDQAKSVVLVEARVGALATTEVIGLTSGRRLVDVRDSMPGLEARRDDFGDSYLRVFVQLDSPLAGLSEHVCELLPNAVHVVGEYPGVERETSAPIRSLPPQEQFVAYFIDERKSSPPPQLVAAFAEVHDEVTTARSADAPA